MSDRVHDRCQLEERIAACVRDRGLLPCPGTPVVAMVSGGCDSVALLFALCALHDELELGSLRVVHVNHMIRGKDADEDEAFVAGLCEKLGVELSVHRVDIPALVEKTRGNLENVARIERYRIANEELDELCQHAGMPLEAGRIVVAHTASDRAETFFMRAIAGAGSGSLSSIAYVNGRIVRPLLDLTRPELEEYVREKVGVSANGATKLWCEDVTNADTEHFRAHVRANIIPAARVFNPRLEAALGRTMDVLHDEDEYLSQVVRGLEETLMVRESPGVVRIDISGFAALPRALMRRVIRDAAREVVPFDVRLDNWHVEQVIDGAEENFSLSLPTGARVFREYDELVFESAERAREDTRWTDGERALIGWLEVPGTLMLPDGSRLSAEHIEVPADVLASGSAASFVGARSAGPDEAFVDIGGMTRLAVMRAYPGLRMRPFGMRGGTKKVARVLIDEKVPERVRGNVPVVMTGAAADDDVVWLAGVRADDRYRLTAHAAVVVHLMYTRV